MYCGYERVACRTDTRICTDSRRNEADCSTFGKNVLREVEEKDFYAALPVLCKESGDRAVLRAIHFFAEDERVVKEVNALPPVTGTVF